MRRVILLVLGVLELACAIVLMVLAWQVPGAPVVEGVTGKVERAGRKAGRQVRILEGQLREIRESHPELLALAQRLRKQMLVVRESVRDRTFNPDALESIREATGQIAEGLDGLATTLDPKGIAQIGKGLGVTAGFLEDKLLPTAERVASSIESAGKTLQTDAKKLSTFLEESPLELKAARSIVESLGKFEEGLAKMSAVKTESFDSVREGIKGMETSLDTGAKQVDRFAGLTIPKVSVKGLKIAVEDREFWPDGKEIADGMRKAARGCESAVKEMDVIKKELPRLRESLDESRKVVSVTRQTLATALKRQEEIEPLLKRLPKHLARLTEELPTATVELSKMLRETSKLKEVAVALRQAEKGIEQAGSRWPRLREGLGQSARVLRVTQKQLTLALHNRKEYEETLQEIVEASATFAESLPAMLERVGTGVEKQEESLGELGASLESVSAGVPDVAQSLVTVLVTVRILLWLFAAVLGIHAGSLLAGFSTAGAEVQSNRS